MAKGRKEPTRFTDRESRLVAEEMARGRMRSPGASMGALFREAQRRVLPPERRKADKIVGLDGIKREWAQMQAILAEWLEKAEKPILPGEVMQRQARDLQSKLDTLAEFVEAEDGLFTFPDGESIQVKRPGQVYTRPAAKSPAQYMRTPDMLTELFTRFARVMDERQDIGKLSDDWFTRSAEFDNRITRIERAVDKITTAGVRGVDSEPISKPPRILVACVKSGDQANRIRNALEGEHVDPVILTGYHKPKVTGNTLPDVDAAMMTGFAGHSLREALHKQYGKENVYDTSGVRGISGIVGEIRKLARRVRKV